VARDGSRVGGRRVELDAGDRSTVVVDVAVLG